MKPREERERSQNEVKGPLFGMFGQIAGLRSFVFPRQSIPSPSRGAPLQFVLTTDRNFEELTSVADQLLGQAMASGQFLFLEKSIDIDRPTISIEIDRNRAGDKLPMEDFCSLAGRSPETHGRRSARSSRPCTRTHPGRE